MNVFFLGIYKNLIVKIGYVLWINTESADRNARPFPTGWLSHLKTGYSTIFTQVFLQLPIKRKSNFLWIEHALIFFGFSTLFVFDIFLTVAGHYGERFFGIDYFMTGLGKAFLKLGMEFSGMVLFFGLTLGLVNRIFCANVGKSAFNVKSLGLLWVLTLSGFLTEAFRLASKPDDPLRSYSFIGGPLAENLVFLSENWTVLADWMWIFHATIAVLFFAYFPFSPLIHIFASPLGRCVTQQADYSMQKKQRISKSLL